MACFHTCPGWHGKVRNWPGRQMLGTGVILSHVAGGGCQTLFHSDPHLEGMVELLRISGLLSCQSPFLIVGAEGSCESCHKPVFPWRPKWKTPSQVKPLSAMWPSCWWSPGLIRKIGFAVRPRFLLIVIVDWLLKGGRQDCSRVSCSWEHTFPWDIREIFLFFSLEPLSFLFSKHYNLHLNLHLKASPLGIAALWKGSYYTYLLVLSIISNIEDMSPCCLK